MPDPNDAFYQSNGGFEVVKDDSGEPRYRVTDAILQKNGYIVNRFIREGRDAGLEVWFTSNNNPDTDMCRFAKACHFLSASRVIGKPALGDAQSRVSFSAPARRPALEPQELQLSRARAREGVENALRTIVTYDGWLEFLT